MAGPGKIEEQLKQPWQLSALLYNFDVGSAELKPEHKEYLRTTVQRYYLYSRGMEAVITGLASRTGPDGGNARLSKSRAASVDDFIHRMDLQQPRLLTHHRFALGEDAARLAGQANGVEDTRYRGVLLQVFDPTKVPHVPPTPAPAPPPPLPKHKAHVLKILKRVYIGAQLPGEAEDKAGFYAPYLYFPVQDVSELVQLFERFLYENVVIEYLSLHSHGSCGSYAFPSGPSLTMEQLHRFRNRGFHRVFLPRAKIRFWSCSMVRDYHGEYFLGEFAKVFLKNGGEVEASADYCYYDVLKGLWSTDVVYCTGAQVVATTTPNSGQVTFRNHRYLSVDRILAAISFLRFALGVQTKGGDVYKGTPWERHAQKPWQPGQDAKPRTTGMSKAEIDAQLLLLDRAEAMVVGNEPDLHVRFLAVTQVEVVAKNVRPHVVAW